VRREGVCDSAYAVVGFGVYHCCAHLLLASVIIYATLVHLLYIDIMASIFDILNLHVVCLGTRFHHV